MSQPRHFVRLFKPRFAPLVEAGTKLQTIRPTPKRVPAPGDRISLRAWTGKPYRSKQRILRETVITHVHMVTITRLNLTSAEYGPWAYSDLRRAVFAKADGFKDWWDMVDWFETEHGLPFAGIVIHWQ